jgi:hypothetical protein
MLFMVQVGDRYAQQLSDAATQYGLNIVEFDIPMFSQVLPERPSGKVVLIGSTRLVQAAYESPEWQDTVMYEPESSRWSVNARRWKGLMLNATWLMTTFNDVDGTGDRFIRPDYDLKEFAGEVMSVNDIRSWAERLRNMNAPEAYLQATTPIIIAPVIQIAREWRVFVVGREAVSCSRYRNYGKFEAIREFPEEVRQLVRRVVARHTPAGYFALDIGVTPEGRYGVIESNGFNCSGWYENDIGLVLKAIEEYETT